MSGDSIASGILNHTCSVFAAEAFAILQAVTYATKLKRKLIICSDSLASIMAIKNFRYNGYSIRLIRNILHKNRNTIKIMWVPGHAGILGNDKADIAAKNATKQPLHLSVVLDRKDIAKFANQFCQQNRTTSLSNISHHYLYCNKDKESPIFPRNLSSDKLRIFSSLRLGHTKCTHSHLLQNTKTPSCPFCGSFPFTVTHLLDDCAHFQYVRTSILNNTTPSLLLRNFTVDNVNLIHRYIGSCKLTNLI